MIEINSILLLNCNIVQFSISLQKKKNLLCFLQQFLWRGEFWKSGTHNGGSDIKKKYQRILLHGL